MGTVRRVKSKDSHRDESGRGAKATEQDDVFSVRPARLLSRYNRFLLAPSFVQADTKRTVDHIRENHATRILVAAAVALPAEIRLYDQLFTAPNPGASGDILADLNPRSLEVLGDCRVEPALAEATPGAPFQFERQGYFCLDSDAAPGRLVFNRTIGLRDTWAKVQAAGGRG